MNLNVVGAHVATGHVAVGIKLPVLVAVGSIPLLGSGVLPFVFEANRYSVAEEGPKLFAQAVVQFARPLVFKERFDCSAAAKELFAVAPCRVE